MKSSIIMQAFLCIRIVLGIRQPFELWNSRQSRANAVWETSLGRCVIKEYSRRATIFFICVADGIICSIVTLRPAPVQCANTLIVPLFRHWPLLCTPTVWFHRIVTLIGRTKADDRFWNYVNTPEIDCDQTAMDLTPSLRTEDSEEYRISSSAY
jgi:hypothetical protein